MKDYVLIPKKYTKDTRLNHIELGALVIIQSLLKEHGEVVNKVLMEKSHVSPHRYKTTINNLIKLGYIVKQDNGKSLKVLK